MKNNLPFVSIIIPCRNEEKFIAKCIESIISQDFPKDHLEVLVLNGMSEDKTEEIAKGYSKKYSFVKVLPNPKKITPVAMNIGIRESKGDVIMKMDAHAVYENNYISDCVKYLEEYEADNVGGVLKTAPSKNTLLARAVALSISSLFGAGNSYFRIGHREPREVDTVAFGCYKKEVFDKIGLYDENLARSQDIELNLRLKKAGGKIVLLPKVVAYYYPQSTLSGFLKHNFVDGIWITYPLKFGVKVFVLRHLIPLTFVLGLIGIFPLSLFLKPFFFLLSFLVILYLVLLFSFSWQIAIKEKEAKLFLLLPLIFFLRHLSYGLGSGWGLIKIFKK